MTIFAAVFGTSYVASRTSVLVYIWDGDFIPNDSRGFSVGHAMITDLSGKDIVSLYPRGKDGLPSGFSLDSEDNTPLTARETFREQDRAPSVVFRVDGLKADPLMAAALAHKARPDWAPSPLLATQTNCVHAAIGVLRAGGLPLVPAVGPVLPWFLGNDLGALSKLPGSGVTAVRTY